MVDLLDIAPQYESVEILGKSVTVPGVSAKGVAYLLGRFPELRKLMVGATVEVEQLMTVGGEAVASIIAAGCGHPGDNKAEEIAAKLPVDTQADLLGAILRVTLPRGLGPFVDKLTALGHVLDVAPSATAPASSSPLPSTP